MQEERERGRIIGLRQRRLATAKWAADFIPLLAEARRALPTHADTGEPSLEAYARWLSDRMIPTRKGKERWHAGTVRRLFNVHIGLVDEAEREFEIAMRIVRFKQRHANAHATDELAAEEAEAKLVRASAIRDARRLSTDLRGHPYDDQPIPDRLDFGPTPRKVRPHRRTPRQTAEAETAKKQISFL
ncbi:MAG: hypothetical protein CL949_06535 [Erythrobacter sp.]|nr:hypothetical protein [Erythrobacter sp.]|tara:strand:+ start:144 stop:704 length:561 start_codon:yes stop_codon:yes gene_type:complete